MVRAPEIIQRDAGDWLAMWDARPAGELQFITQDLSGIIPQRHALSGMVYDRVARAFGPRAALEHPHSLHGHPEPQR